MTNRILSKLLFLSCSALLMSCSFTTGTSSPAIWSGTSTTTSSSSSSSLSIASSAVSVSETGDTSGLTITTPDGAYSTEGSTVTISTSGTYTLSGKLNGIIYIDVDDDGEVELDLNGVTLVSPSNSPIYAANAGSLKIKALKDTKNVIQDQRSAKSSDVDGQGEGAIYAACDLKLVGTGTLSVTGNYNNGIHGTDDVTIKNQNLTVIAYNHAVKGNDSITIEEGGSFYLIARNGDGLHTQNSDLSAKGNQRGSITLTGGVTVIHSYGDGIDAAYDVSIASGLDSDGNKTTPSLEIHTNKYSSYYSSSSSNLVQNTDESSQTVAYMGPSRGNPGGNMGGNPGGQSSSSSSQAEDSAKGIKAANAINVEGGIISIESYDDGLHANYGDTLENGNKGNGDVAISGGTLSISASDDGIHADRYLNISGGTLTVTAYEGLEGNQITVSGGSSAIYGTDDAVNATSGPLSETYFKSTGGYLFAEVSSNGDVDGIDSNRNIYIQGGTVIAAGPNSGMASPLDADGVVNVTSGTLVLIGAPEKSPSTSLTTSSLTSSFNAGSSYRLTIGSAAITTPSFAYSHSSTKVYSYSELGSLTAISKVS